MKTFLLILFVFISQSSELTEVRKQYPTASDSKEASDALLKLVDHISTSNSKTLVAYKGAAITLQAKHAGTIASKKKYFLEGAALVEQAISSEPSNIEIRLIRLSIQENTPKILNYKKNIAEDKTFILQNLGSQNSVLRDYVLQYALKSKAFSEQDKALLRKNTNVDNRN